MASKLLWGILIGLIVGAALGAVMGNTPVGIAICMAAGAIAAGVVHYLQQRRAGGSPPGQG